jgi:Nickel responsive protein SCO4226-like
VRYVDSIYAPEDETCFHVFDGPSAAVVSDAARRASLPFQRVVEVVESPAQAGR